MGQSVLSLGVAPELTLEDLSQIKIPRDLVESLSLDFCTRNRILPLRLDPHIGILSFAFVDQTSESELEDLKKRKRWTFLSGYKISLAHFELLLTSLKSEIEAQGERWGLVDPKEERRKALHLLSESVPQLFGQLEELKSYLEETRSLSSVLVHREAYEQNVTLYEELQKTYPEIQFRLFTPTSIKNALLTSSENNDFDFHLKHDDPYQASLSLLKSGHMNQAIDLLERVGAQDPQFQNAKLVLGKAFMKKRNFKKAAQHLQKAYDHWCEDPDAIVDDTILNILYYLGLSFEKSHRSEDALKLFERIAGENPLFKQVSTHLVRLKEHVKKANKTRERKEGFPAFSQQDRGRHRYERIEEIGRGGMGIVYRSRDRILGREVALKILNSHFKHDEKIVETFLREAKSLAALNHLHIVTVFDAGIEDGNYYISMEFIEGKTIRELLKKKGHFRLSTTTILAKQVLKALAYAHSKKVIHRDITTNNMMLTDSKIIKLMDFGLARVVNQLHSEQSIIGGTPYFMSPEQVEGAPIDHRTDIYSFGVCLFEMLTGQVPFPMENPGYHHLHTPPPSPRSIKSDIPELMEIIILKCLQKKPDDRFINANEILEMLRQTSLEDEASLLSGSHDKSFIEGLKRP